MHDKGETNSIQSAFRSKANVLRSILLRVVWNDIACYGHYDVGVPAGYMEISPCFPALLCFVDEPVVLVSSQSQGFQGVG